MSPKVNWAVFNEGPSDSFNFEIGFWGWLELLKTYNGKFGLKSLVWQLSNSKISSFFSRTLLARYIYEVHLELCFSIKTQHTWAYFQKVTKHIEAIATRFIQFFYESETLLFEYSWNLCKTPRSTRWFFCGLWSTAKKQKKCCYSYLWEKKGYNKNQGAFKISVVLRQCLFRVAYRFATCPKFLSSDFQIGFETFTSLKITKEGAIECACGGLNSRQKWQKIDIFTCFFIFNMFTDRCL